MTGYQLFKLYNKQICYRIHYVSGNLTFYKMHISNPAAVNQPCMLQGHYVLGISQVLKQKIWMPPSSKLCKYIIFWQETLHILCNLAIMPRLSFVVIVCTHGSHVRCRFAHMPCTTFNETLYNLWEYNWLPSLPTTHAYICLIFSWV